MNCPACGNELEVGFELRPNAFVAWCGHGPCPSAKANHGAFGKTEAEAISNLVALLEKKPDWKQDDEPPLTKEDIEHEKADHYNQIKKDEQ